MACVGRKRSDSASCANASGERIVIVLCDASIWWVVMLGQLATGVDHSLPDRLPRDWVGDNELSAEIPTQNRRPPCEEFLLLRVRVRPFEAYKNIRPGERKDAEHCVGPQFSS